MHKLYVFIVAGIIATLICGYIYVSGQQRDRLSFNELQVQISRDLAARLASGVPVSTFRFSPSVDMSKSLVQFIIVYGEDGKVAASTGILGKNVPQVPKGVLAFAREHDDDRITWQPQDSVRIAAVVRYYHGTNASGFVLVGRSLKEREARELHVLYTSIIAWLVILGSIGVSVYCYPVPKQAAPHKKRA